MLYIHTTDHLYPRTANLHYECFWTYTLADGSNIVGIKSSNVAAMKVHIATSAAALNVTVHTLPTIRNGGTIHADTQASIVNHFAMTPGTTAPLTTNQVLSKIFAVLSDQAFDPDGAA